MNKPNGKEFPPQHDHNPLGIELSHPMWRFLSVEEVQQFHHAETHEGYPWLSLQEIQSWSSISHTWTSGYAGSDPTLTYRTSLSKDELLTKRAERLAKHNTDIERFRFND